MIPLLEQIYKVKKLLAIFLISAYSFSSQGLAINSHFCGDVLINKSLAELGEKKHCNCLTENKPSDCCKDTLLYQKADIHETAQVLFNNVPEFTPSIFVQYFDHTVNVLEIDHSEISINTFIRCQLGPIYLLNRVFRI